MVFVGRGLLYLVFISGRHQVESVHRGSYMLISYSRKLSRKKTFTNFEVLWLFVKVFAAKFWDVASLGAVRVSNPQKFSPRRSYFPPIRKSFCPKVFRYTVSVTSTPPINASYRKLVSRRKGCCISIVQFPSRNFP